VADPQELFFALALDDIRAAAQILRPAYEASGGRDGFVSFEVTTDLADDAEATVAQAVRLRARLSRPNVVIKVPATDAGSRPSRSSPRAASTSTSRCFSRLPATAGVDAIARPS
jgi:hypothetical protein